MAKFLLLAFALLFLLFVLGNQLGLFAESQQDAKDEGQHPAPGMTRNEGAGERIKVISVHGMLHGDETGASLGWRSKCTHNRAHKNAVLFGHDVAAEMVRPLTL
jgi:hypothetical protein